MAFDVIVVGGGAAGAAITWLLAKEGDIKLFVLKEARGCFLIVIHQPKTIGNC